MAAKVGRKRIRTPGEEEAIYACYCEVQSYSEASRRMKVPVTSVFNIVQRIATERDLDLEAVRKTHRARVVTLAWEKAEQALAMFNPRKMKPEFAARAASDLSRAASVLEPKDTHEAETVATIIVKRGFGPVTVTADAPAADVQQGEAQDSTLPKER